MKFTDGYWLMRKGYEPNYAAQAYDVETDAESLTVYAPTKKISSRGDMLNLPMLTVRSTSPMEGVIRVQAVHHKGGKTPDPQFEIHSQPQPKLEIQNPPEAA